MLEWPGGRLGVHRCRVRSLRRKGIRRAIRIRKATVLDDLPADEWFGDLQPGQFRVITEKTWVFGGWMRAAKRLHRRCSGQEVVATRSSMGDLVIIATDVGVWETWKLYKLRWSVERTFGSSKTRGFDLERTGVTQPKRFERLFGLVILAWISLLRVGIWLHEVKPIKGLAYGRKAVSLLRSGSEHLRNALRWDPEELAELLILLIFPFSALGAT